MSEGKVRRKYIIETVVLSVVLVIGLAWGGFELWLHKVADVDRLLDYAWEACEKKQHLKAEIYTRLALRKGNKQAIKFLTLIKYLQQDIDGSLYWIEEAKKNKITGVKNILALCYEAKGRYADAAKLFVENIWKQKKTSIINFWGALQNKFNVDRSVHYSGYQKLADAGNADACLVVALSYAAEKNESETLIYYQKALELIKNDAQKKILEIEIMKLEKNIED